MYYSHKFIKGVFKKLYTTGKIGAYVEINSTFQIEQIFLVAYMSEVKC